MRRLNALLRRRTTLTPAEFVKLTPEQQAAIKHTRIVPPTLGRADFGGIEVTYKTPRYFMTMPSHD